MSELLFISEVIYDLKMDYGGPVVLRRSTVVTDPSTGNKVEQNIDKPINLAINLPREKSHAFLRTIGGDKMGYLQPEQQEFIIDKIDLDAPVQPFNQILVGGKKLKINKFEDYHHAYYIVASNG